MVLQQVAQENSSSNQSMGEIIDITSSTNYGDSKIT